MAEPEYGKNSYSDDFDINAFLSQVSFDDTDTFSAYPPSSDGLLGDTGEYAPVSGSRENQSGRRVATPEPTPKKTAQSKSGEGKKPRDAAGEGNPERKRPVRKHTRKKPPLGIRILRKSLLFVAYLMIVVVISYFLARAGWNWANDLLALDKDEVSVTIELDEYYFTVETTLDEDGNETTTYVADMDAVADLLQENGLIEYRWLFKLFASVTSKDTKINPGSYELDSDMDYSALLRNMTSTTSSRTTVTVTIPEGYTLEQIIELLVANGVCDEEDLWDTAANYDFSYDFLDSETLGESNRLEGFLFPDTYEFYQSTDAVTALNKLLYNFNYKIYSELDQVVLAQAIADGYSLRDLVIIASIVEKETDGVDQTGIASVIYNRLTRTDGGTNGYLQMDSTIQYALEERKETLTAEDLAIDSPYNTYLYAGLPAGPICNPGLEALQAALNPDSTDYFYFILGSDGSTHFFETYEEFIAYKDSMPATATTEEEEEDVPEG